MGAKTGKTKQGEKKQEFTELVMCTAAVLCRAIFGGLHIRNLASLSLRKQTDKQAHITSTRAGRLYEVLSKLGHFVGDRENAENLTPATLMFPMATKPGMWQVCPSDFLAIPLARASTHPIEENLFSILQES